MALPELDVARARRWCAARVPEHARHQVRVECEVASRHHTIVERRAPWREDFGPEWTSFPIARLRYTAASKSWTLYWRDRNLRFHFYELLAPSHRVDDLLTEIDRDPPAYSGGNPWRQPATPHTHPGGASCRRHGGAGRVSGPGSAGPSLVVMRYRRAVEKLRILAEACDSVKNWPLEDPLLLEAYAFGDVLEGADPLKCVKVALVLNLPPEEVPWESSPHGTSWLADRLRLDKGGIAYWWRSHLTPLPNHRIREPVRFWSREGPDEAVLQALADRRFDDLPRLVQSPQAEREYLAADLAAALGRLRAVHASYWDHDWRCEHRDFGRYPEHHLWEAVQGYLDLHDAAGAAD